MQGKWLNCHIAKVIAIVCVNQSSNRQSNLAFDCCEMWQAWLDLMFSLCPILPKPVPDQPILDLDWLGVLNTNKQTNKQTGTNLLFAHHRHWPSFVIWETPSNLSLQHHDGSSAHTRWLLVNDTHNNIIGLPCETCFLHKGSPVENGNNRQFVL